MHDRVTADDRAIERDASERVVETRVAPVSRAAVMVRPTSIAGVSRNIGIIGAESPFLCPRNQRYRRPLDVIARARFSKTGFLSNIFIFPLPFITTAFAIRAESRRGNKRGCLLSKGSRYSCIGNYGGLGRPGVSTALGGKPPGRNSRRRITGGLPGGTREDRTGGKSRETAGTRRARERSYDGKATSGVHKQSNSSPTLTASVLFAIIETSAWDDRTRGAIDALHSSPPLRRVRLGARRSYLPNFWNFRVRTNCARRSLFSSAFRQARAKVRYERWNNNVGMAWYFRSIIYQK